MSETLWVAIIVGSTGVAATIPPIIANYYRWKKEKKLEYLEKKLEYLKAERRYREEQYSNILSKLDVCIKRGNQFKDIRIEIGLKLPHEIGNKIYNILDKKWNGDVNREEVIPWEIEIIMRKSLDEMDREIKETMS